MNVWPSLCVMETLPAPTHSGPSCVLATQDILEMDWRAVVSAFLGPVGMHREWQSTILGATFDQQWCLMGITGDIDTLPWGHFCNFQPADVDECVTQSPCHASASCTNTLGSYTCACNTGYTGDGLVCSGECLNAGYRSYINAENATYARHGQLQQMLDYRS